MWLIMMLFGLFSSFGIMNLLIVGINISMELVIMLFLVSGMIIWKKVFSGWVLRFSEVFISE